MGDTHTVAAAPRPALWYFTTAASIAVGVLPIWILEARFGVPRKISVGYGILAYVLGTTALKLPLHHFVVERFLRRRLSSSILAGVQGIVSAVSELGVAGAFLAFVVPPLSWWHLVGFGAGAGACEAVMLPFIANPFKGTTLQQHAGEVFVASARSAGVQWLSVLERVWAMLFQISTRGLVGLSILTATPWPALAAVAGFAAADGTAYYGHLRRWRFDSLPVLVRVHAAMAAAALALAALFLWWSGQAGVR